MKTSHTPPLFTFTLVLAPGVPKESTTNMPLYNLRRSTESVRYSSALWVFYLQSHYCHKLTTCDRHRKCELCENRTANQRLQIGDLNSKHDFHTPPDSLSHHPLPPPSPNTCPSLHTSSITHTRAFTRKSAQNSRTRPSLKPPNTTQCPLQPPPPPVKQSNTKRHPAQHGLGDTGRALNDPGFNISSPSLFMPMSWVVSVHLCACRYISIHIYSKYTTPYATDTDIYCE